MPQQPVEAGLLPGRKIQGFNIAGAAHALAKDFCQFQPFSSRKLEQDADVHVHGATLRPACAAGQGLISGDFAQVVPPRR